MKIAKIALLSFVIFFITVGTALVLAEEFLRATNSVNVDWKIAKIHQPDAELGYSGVPNAADEESMKIGKKVAYSTRLQLDANGYREVPARPQRATPRCVLLLGDSNPFGIGVEANETVAALLQQKLRNTRVFNLGYTGYGPHQNLRQLEIGRERDLLKGCREVHAVLFAMEDHVHRVAGRTPWGLSAPRYVLKNAIPVHQGYFWPEWVDRWNNRAQKYFVTRPIVGFLLGYHRKSHPRDRELYRGVVKRIGTILKERYSATFRILFLGRGEVPNEIVRSLEPMGVPTDYVEELAIRAGKGHNILHSFYLDDETHLNPAGHALVADHLLRGELIDWTR